MVEGAFLREEGDPGIREGETGPEAHEEDDDEDEADEDDEGLCEPKREEDELLGERGLGDMWAMAGLPVRIISQIEEPRVRLLRGRRFSLRKLRIERESDWTWTGTSVNGLPKTLRT